MRLKFFFLALSDSKPNSWYSFSWEVPLIAPVIARDALYRTLSIYYCPIHFLPDHILSLSSVEKIITWACFDGSGLKDIFHLLAQRPTLSRSFFSFCEVLIGLLTTENIEESSAKSFTLASRLPDKSLIHI